MAHPLLQVTEPMSAQLTVLRQRLLLMSGRVEDMIARSVQALAERDRELARATILMDRRVNQDEIEIDQLCFGMLSKGEVSGTDLRFLTFALKVVTDLERIGDLAVNICERALELASDGNAAPFVSIPEMGHSAAQMLAAAIDAFVTADEPGARQVIDSDDHLDDLYHTVFRDRMVRLKQGDLDVGRAVRVQNIAKYLERIGDHCTNIAEHVILLVDGTDVRHLGRRTK